MVFKRDKYDLSYTNTLSLNMGNLVPIMCKPLVAGDEFKIKPNYRMQLAPLVSPVMSNVDVCVDTFFVPNRLLWDNPNDSEDSWESFITGSKSGDNASVMPYIVLPETVDAGSLLDYLGSPLKNSTNNEFSALPIRAYNLIYNEYYRDENLQDPLKISLTGGEDTETSLNIQRRCWQKDYFTTATLSPQRGSPVIIPLTGDAPVYGESGKSLSLQLVNDVNQQRPLSFGASDSKINYTGGGLSGGAQIPEKGRDTTVYADLSNVTAVNINDLRDASSVQIFKEKSQTGGYRYVEWIKTFFGVNSGDARLQRPEFIGRSKAPILFSTVLQTSESTSTSAQGNLAGSGISVMDGKPLKYYAREHGFLISIMSILPQTSYYQGIPREYLKKSRYEFLLPEFSHLGDQEIYNAEIYSQSVNPTDIFGFQKKFAEYRTYFNEIHGEFKGNLDFWHMGRKFDSEPALNSKFVESDPTGRIFAVQDSDISQQVYLFIAMNIAAKRPLPRYPQARLY